MNPILKKASYIILPTWFRGIVKRLYLKIIRQLWRMRSIKYGKGAFIGSYFRINNKTRNKAYLGDYSNTEEYNIWDLSLGPITIGKNCFFGLHNIVMGPVEIGDNLSTGPHVKILGPRHAITGYENIDVNKKTIIGNNVWISTDSIILSGVTIGDNAVIGPASLVTKDVPPGAYVAGNPARDLTRVTSFKSAEKSND